MRATFLIIEGNRHEIVATKLSWNNHSLIFYRDIYDYNTGIAISYYSTHVYYIIATQTIILRSYYYTTYIMFSDHSCPVLVPIYAASCSPACETGYTCVAPNMCRGGVQLMLNGVNYPNNSIIQYDSIYNSFDYCHSLLCTTDRVPCCTVSQGGNWYQVRISCMHWHRFELFLYIPKLSYS